MKGHSGKKTIILCLDIFVITKSGRIRLVFKYYGIFLLGTEKRDGERRRGVERKERNKFVDLKIEVGEGVEVEGMGTK